MEKWIIKMFKCREIYAEKIWGNSKIKRTMEVVEMGGIEERKGRERMG